MYYSYPTKQYEILLVEDSPADVLIAREALDEAELRGKVHVAEDGVEALAFLRRQRRVSAAPRPDLILLELNLPRMNGRELLAEIKSDPLLCTIPVVVLTTSSADEDVRISYGLHANCYVVKPVEFDRFVNAVQSIRHFWFDTVTLPLE